jgi:hypothetical protein
MSRNTEEQYFLFSKVLLIHEQLYGTAGLLNEWRKPNWCCGITSRRGSIFGSKSFSRSLDIVDKRLMGLYDDTWLVFFQAWRSELFLQLLTV